VAPKVAAGDNPEVERQKFNGIAAAEVPPETGEHSLKVAPVEIEPSLKPPFAEERQKLLEGAVAEASVAGKPNLKETPVTLEENKRGVAREPSNRMCATVIFALSAFASSGPLHASTAASTSATVAGAVNWRSIEGGRVGGHV